VPMGRSCHLERRADHRKGRAGQVRVTHQNLARDFRCTQQDVDLPPVRVCGADGLLHCYEGTLSMYRVTQHQQCWEYCKR